MFSNYGIEILISGGFSSRMFTDAWKHHIQKFSKSNECVLGEKLQT